MLAHLQFSGPKNKALLALVDYNSLQLPNSFPVSTCLYQIENLMNEELGRVNKFQVIELVSYGAYLQSESLGEVLLPNKYLPQGTEVGETLQVFVYLDSEDTPVATTQRPRVQVGEFANLKVLDQARHGSFLDWGIAKDLLVPNRQQREPMEVGRSYLVRCYIDEQSGRIAASSKLDRFLDQWPARFEEGEEVSLIIAAKTDLGYKAIINNSHWGVLYQNEVFKPLRIGSRVKGFIKKVRSDAKIDLSLQRSSHEQINGFSLELLNRIKKAGGTLPVGDKTSPETIKSMFGVSKRVFKQSIGTLYKQRLIELDRLEIRLLDK